MAKFSNFMFSVPNLPKGVYLDLKAIAAQFNLDHQQMVILGVLCVKEMNKLNRQKLIDLVKSLGGTHDAT